MTMKRLLWADSLKGILIVLVLLGHAIQETLKAGCFENHVWNYIYSFHMPAFMAVSGFLNYRMGVVTKRLSTTYRRFQQLMIPFFCWAIIQFVITPPYQIKSLVDVVLYPEGSFWFLWVLFFISVIYILGDWFAEKLKVKQEVVIAFLSLLFVVLMVAVDIRVLGFQYIAYYFLFYSLGYYLHKYNKAVTSNNCLLFVLSIVWAVMAWFWNMHKLPTFLSTIPLPSTMLQYAYRFVTAAIAVYVLFGVSPKLLNNEAKWNQPMLRLGKISLGIYTTHILIIPFIVGFLKSISPLSSIEVVIIAFIIALTLAWLLTWLLSKLKITNRLLLGKIQ